MKRITFNLLKETFIYIKKVFIYNVIPYIWNYENKEFAFSNRENIPILVLHLSQVTLLINKLASVYKKKTAEKAKAFKPFSLHRTFFLSPVIQFTFLC